MTRSSGPTRVVYQIASWCLDYPSEALVDRLQQLRDALDEQPDSAAIRQLGPLVDYLGDQVAHGRLAELQQHYVDVFDLSRKRALHLSYWTDGDTRRRGEVLARFKADYRAGGFLVDTGGELPDYLPMVLEFAAVVDLDAGRAMLQQYRASVELLRLALLDAETPYAAAVTAVCATLPGPSPADRAAVMAMAGGPPPTEFVGLEPYDPRLLPLQPVEGRP
jgi:nitrate reductase molybdenum cofactor assembly chaperone NarJ/NarW